MKIKWKGRVAARRVVWSECRHFIVFECRLQVMPTGILEFFLSRFKISTETWDCFMIVFCHLRSWDLNVKYWFLNFHIFRINFPGYFSFNVSCSMCPCCEIQIHIKWNNDFKGWEIESDRAILMCRAEVNSHNKALFTFTCLSLYCNKGHLDNSSEGEREKCGALAVLRHDNEL